MLIAIKIDERVVKVSRLNHVIVTQSYFRVTLRSLISIYKSVQ